MCNATRGGKEKSGNMDVERITGVAGALSDGTRLRLLAMLLEGPKAVSELAAGLGMVQPGVSAHLGVLREARLVVCEAVGRQRVYRVREHRIEGLLGALAALSGEGMSGADLGAQAAREALRESPFREARSCYDHLGGLAGVRLLQGMIERGWLEVREAGGRTVYGLTPVGERALRERNVDVKATRRARRIFALGCADWTELEPHLGGALGAAVFGSLQDAGVARRRRGERTVAVLTPPDHWLRWYPGE